MTDEQFIWKQVHIDSARTRIRTELDGVPDQADRLELILKRIAATESRLTSASRLERYIYSISALVHDVRVGGLTERQTEKLVKLCFALLQAQGLDEEASRLPYLFSDVHTVHSQILRKNGEHWFSAWELSMAGRGSSEVASGDLGFTELLMANRTLRLGYGELAVQYANTVLKLITERKSGTLDLRWRAQLVLMTSYRLMGNHAAALQHIVEALKWDDLPDPVRHEFKWNRFCVEAIQTQDLSALEVALKRQSPYHTPAYLLEFALWCYATPTKKWLALAPPLHALFRRKNGAVDRKDPLFLCASRIQECYDGVRPLKSRMTALGQVLSTAKQIIGIDREILVWAAADRWLTRVRARDLAGLVRAQYEQLSLTASGGLHRDVYHFLKPGSLGEGHAK